MRNKIGILAVAIGVGAAAIWGYQAYNDRYPGTDDAYIGADVVRVTPLVAGRVAQVPIVDQQQVQHGDLLFAINEDTFNYSLKQAEAQLTLARRQVSSAEAAVTSAEANVHHHEVLLDNARARAQRARSLTSKEYMSKQDVDDAEAEYKSADANLRVARASLEEARRQLGSPGDENDRVVAALAAVDHARWALDNTRITAPCNGQVSQLQLRPGDVVNANSSVFVLICEDHYWVDANFKETQVDNISVGQPVDVKVDMYPNHHFKGRVASISGAAGSVFSLLPPQNANGNWVKVTQRVPVRIDIENSDPDFPLRVGTSSVVSIDTTAHTPSLAMRDNPPKS